MQLPTARRPHRFPALLLSATVPLVLLAAPRLGRASDHRVSAVIIGGSTAAGWRDGAGPGYVVRGLRRYGAMAGVRFVIKNHAIPGARVVNPLTARDLGGWLSAAGQGAVLVVAWGMLNDLRLRTPRVRVADALGHQIRAGLDAGDAVLVVTPPATRATFEEDRASEASLVHEEIRVARSFQTRRVAVADVFSAMKAYLAVHQSSYKNLMADRSHPNTAGHRLASRILAAALRRLWGRSGRLPPATP
jgi:hypothetical protein